MVTVINGSLPIQTQAILAAQKTFDDETGKYVALNGNTVDSLNEVVQLNIDWLNNERQPALIDPVVTAKMMMEFCKKYWGVELTMPMIETGFVKSDDLVCSDPSKLYITAIRFAVVKDHKVDQFMKAVATRKSFVLQTNEGKLVKKLDYGDWEILSALDADQLNMYFD